ncbi:hypothetical protein NPX13_g7112 [Xylaria arbuscula]|uniref:Hsp70 family chaperone n=1 Tax=Xylaria arbuscula TaxID=114810 RepID=A0A9W8TL37_9PEZI|nr:hypothetical protein NPX13_g7112 [Xylaria arbuscula]
MSHDRPDIIVAVDFGTSYTGVAWARPQRIHALQSPIQILDNWPGVSNKNEQKVPSCLVYNEDGSVSSWGFLCEDDDDPAKERYEFFKIYLDEETFEEARLKGTKNLPKSVEHAQKLSIDFLKQIYNHSKSTIELHTGISRQGWRDLKVEFIFSVPTTWRTQGMINIFKECITLSGFGMATSHHSANVELTESEAAAVATIKSSVVTFQPGDVFMSVDAGGGTTDLAVMQVKEAREPFPSLSQISQVDGIGIGATLIDRAFVSYVNRRLGKYPELIDQLPPNCGERLAKGDKFKTTKHKFGEKVYQSNCYKMALEGAAFHLNHAAAGIEEGKVVISWEEMQDLFDPHVEGTLQKIREQLDWAQRQGNCRSIDYLILSGGLGSSKYVRDRLQRELTINPHPFARQIKIIQASNPQLVVVKGLLHDRLQSLEPNTTPVIVSRIARASYGIVCKRRYNPLIHIHDTIQKDPCDGEKYALSQIDWIIKKGDRVSTNAPITQTFTQRIEAGDANRMWDSQVVISDRDPGRLPRNIQEEGVNTLCVVRSDLTGIHYENMVKMRKSKRFLFKGAKFYQCTFEMHAIVAPAEIRFELWFAGQKFSGNHEPIRINWDNEGIKVGDKVGVHELAA